MFNITNVKQIGLWLIIYKYTFFWKENIIILVYTFYNISILACIADFSIFSIFFYGFW